MTDIVFGRIPDVPICETGDWPASTGPVTFTTADFAAAEKAVQECPAVRNPALILGHTDAAGQRANGWPAVGWLGNLHVENDGHTLVADYEGMPEWLAAAAASAYPDRSVEGAWGYRCSLGHTHDFVITALALLGEERPAVGTLTSLQDIAGLYGVQVAAEHPEPVRAFHTNPTGAAMPDTVLAVTSADDIRREFYEDAGWSVWIREIDVDPAQLIVEDEGSDGGLYRIPYTISGDTITFGERIAVVTEYRDLPTTTAAQIAALGPRTIRAAYADRTQSRPGTPQPPASPAVDPKAAAGGSTPKEVGMSDTLIDSLRTQLGLAADADEATVQAAVAEALTERAEPATTIPDGAVLVDASVLTELRAHAELGRQAHARQAETDRDTAIKAAVDTGRIAPSRREHFAKAWAADPEGTRTVLASLEPGLVPLTELGTDAGASNDVDAEYDALVSRLSRPSMEA